MFKQFNLFVADKSRFGELRALLDQARVLSKCNPAEALGLAIEALRIQGGEQAVMIAMQVYIWLSNSSRDMST